MDNLAIVFAMGWPDIDLEVVSNYYQPDAWLEDGPFGVYMDEWRRQTPAMKEKYAQEQYRREPNNPPGIEYLREGGRS